MDEGTGYVERLAVPAWWWPAGLALGALLAAEVHAGAGGAQAVLPYALVLPAVVAGLLALSRGRVEVSGGMLRVPGARMPLRFVGRAVPLTGPQVRRLLGPAAGAHAHVATRGWIAGAVRIEVDDPADPTPFWLVSSRHPDQLVAALQRGRAAAPQ